MKKEKEKKYDKIYPPEDCPSCGGRGEVKDDYIAGGLFGPSSHWTYKKCTNCNGTGKNIWVCISCGGKLHNTISMWCSNLNCKFYGVLMALGSKLEK